MAGWTAMVGTHEFVAPDQTHAEHLARALSAHGFAYVTAQRSGYGWRVTAVDDGPYEVSPTGHRTIQAVGRAAAAVARHHRAYPQGGSRCDISLLTLLTRTDAPVIVTNPGARPPVPQVVEVPAPPRAALALTPDDVRDVPIDLGGLDDIDWAQLSHAHGAADDIPDLLRALADPYGDWDADLDELFGDNLLHQGSCYSATAPALPFLTRLIASGALPARQRQDLYAWLVFAAGRWAASLIADAGQASVQDRRPKPAAWTEQIHATVGEQIPALLQRWDVEPPAVRFLLACLAGLYPHHGQPVADRINELRGACDGTQAGVYLLLAQALLDRDDAWALRVAADIAAWADDHGPDWLEAPGVTVAVRTGRVLAEGALRCIG